MTKHTITNAQHLYRGKDRKEGINPGPDKTHGDRGIRMYPLTRYSIENVSGSAVLGSSVNALASAGSASSIALTTTTMTGNSEGSDGSFLFARQIQITYDDSADEAAFGTAIGLDIHGATVTSIFPVVSASTVLTDKAFAVIHSLNIEQLSCTAKVGYAGGFGLPYHLNDAHDGVVANVRASGPDTTADANAVLWTAGVTAAGTVSNSGGDPRGIVTFPANVVDGSAHMTVWYYVEQTDIAYGPGRGDGGGGNA